MRIALVTDAWHPQVNGVVFTWSYIARELERLGHTLHVISPQGSRTVQAPSEPGVRLCIEPFAHLRREMRRLWGDAAPDALHIATEGPLGLAARRMAIKRGWPFTTSYHTRFPEYLAARLHVPLRWTYRVMRWFHRPASHVLVPTPRVREELQARGFEHLRDWTRGVDAERFAPCESQAFADLPRPIFLSAGRVAAEKNLEAFLALDLPGTKVVAGGGPAEAKLRRTFPDAVWLGMKRHDELPALYAAADVFVFPSRTDTFGLVMLEAMACGCPVAAFPVPGPIDVVTPGLTGMLDEDLQRACLGALHLDRQRVRQESLAHTWTGVAQSLLSAVVPLPQARRCT